MPTTIAFRIVPSPGRCRRGIHVSSTRKLIATVAAPIASGVWTATPSASTVQGELPSSLATSIASPVPKIHRPASSLPRVAGPARQRLEELILAREDLADGIVREDPAHAVG